MKFYYFIISITLISQIVFAQPFNDPMKFFPAKTGNMWEYFYYDMPYTDTLQTITLKDSIDLDGKVYIWNESHFINPISPPVLTGSNYYEIDTAYNVKGFYEDTTAILFKLAANQGDQWVIRRYSHTFEMIRVDTVYVENLFGINTIIKAYRNYLAFDSTETTGLDRSARLLAYGFGIVNVYGLEGLGELYIKGAVINGTLYGDTTKIITSVFDPNPPTLPADFVVHQNYPNPFNSETIIDFKVDKTTELNLMVFDMLGKKIRTLVSSNFYHPGLYNIKWDGKDDFSNPVTSGVYFYQVCSNNRTILKKMILIK